MNGPRLQNVPVPKCGTAQVLISMRSVVASFPQFESRAANSDQLSTCGLFHTGMVLRLLGERGKIALGMCIGFYKNPILPKTWAAQDIPPELRQRFGEM